MPLPEQRRRVTRVRQKVRDRVLPRRHPALPLTGVRHLEGSRTHRLTARHDGRTRRRALSLDRVIVEADTLAGELVDARSRGDTAVAREVTPTDVVTQDEHDVRLLVRHD